MSSSVGTYLDLVGSRGQSAGADAGFYDAELTTQGGKVLAAINAGKTTLSEITAATGLDLREAFSALTLLANTNLVELSDENGDVHAKLTGFGASALHAN